MKKYLNYIAVTLVAVMPFLGFAAVSVNSDPTALITTRQFAPASSDPIGLYKFGLSANAGEILTGVRVVVFNVAPSNAIGANIDNLAIYRDDGDGDFESNQDTLVGKQTTVNIGTSTTVNATSNNSLPGTFFLALQTSDSWSDAAPADDITVSLPSNGLMTSANSPTTGATITADIKADTSGPMLTSVTAQDTGGTSAKEAGDSLVFQFNEATTKPDLTDAQVDDIFSLNHDHDLLDDSNNLAAASWNTTGTRLTIVLSGDTPLASVAVGDTVTVMGSLIKDEHGNAATGSATVAGTFGEDEDTDGPEIISAVAKNTGGTAAKEAGDTIEITFSENTNKPTINAVNIDQVLDLSSGHSFRDGDEDLGGASWNSAGNKLTITLSDDGGIASVAIGDTVTVVTNLIKDVEGNATTGSTTITGSFGEEVVRPHLSSAVAMNTGGTAAKEAGDRVEITFTEPTNKPSITAANIDNLLDLSSGHSFRDNNNEIQSATWNSAGDKLTIILSGSATVEVGDIVTLRGTTIKDVDGNVATGSIQLTGTFGAFMVSPRLLSAIAQDDNGTSAKAAGDRIVVTFSEPTIKPNLTAANIDSVLVLSSNHSWLDGDDNLGGASWNSTGDVLTIILSDEDGLPTVAIGDTVRVMTEIIRDLDGNPATGSVVITGSFGLSTPPPVLSGRCSNGLTNGQLYRRDGQIYLAAACRLKVFKGNAVGQANGVKFQNIIDLPSTQTQSRSQSAVGQSTSTQQSKPAQSASASRPQAAVAQSDQSQIKQRLDHYSDLQVRLETLRAKGYGKK